MENNNHSPRLGIGGVEISACKSEHLCYINIGVYRLPDTLQLFEDLEINRFFVFHVIASQSLKYKIEITI